MARIGFAIYEFADDAEAFPMKMQKINLIFCATPLLCCKSLWYPSCTVIGQASERTLSREALQERKVQAVRAVSRVSKSSKRKPVGSTRT
jgi:hypothetical protein